MTDKDYDPSLHKDSPWYSPDLKTTEGWEPTRDLLVSYTGIRENEVLGHVNKIRDRAWKVAAYPCIGQFRFLDLSIKDHPYYSQMLQRVKDGQTLLDIGCCFGQDERRFVADGAPAENLHACDLLIEFPNLGYELFLDKDKLRTHFFAADVFDTTNSSLNALDCQIDIVNASSFFHLFSLSEQKTAAKRVVRLLKNQAGSMIAGRQQGNTTAGTQPGRVPGSGDKFRHNAESWDEMWKEVGGEMGRKFRTEVEFDDAKGWSRTGQQTWNRDGSQPMRFTVWQE